MDKKKSKYMFYELPMAEILQIMEDLRFPILETDISKPSAPQVQRVYEFFLDIFTGVSKESYSQPPLAVLEMLEYPELHLDSLGLVSFYRIM